MPADPRIRRTFRPLLAAAAGAWALAGAAAQAPPADPLRFDIWEYAVEGNTVLPALPIERAVLPYLGPGRTMADVEAARGALEAAYQKAGYLTVLVDVPEQRVEGGVVRLAVLEGRIGRLHVAGAQYHAPGVIRRELGEAEEGRVPDFNRLQQQIAAVSRPDEIAIQPVLKPGRVPGTVDMDLQVTDRLPLSGSVELHNDHPRDTDPWRLSASARWANLWQRGHALALTLATAPAEPSQSQVAILNYDVPFEGGRTLGLYAVHSDSDVESLGGTTALGNGLTVGLRWSEPVGTGDGASHVLTAGIDYKDLEETVTFGEGRIETPVRYLPMQLAWQSFFGIGAAREQLGLTFAWAFRQIARRDVPCPTADGREVPTDQFACKRAGADGSFAILRFDWRHRQPLGAFALAARFAGQGASKPLISAEQFTLGGSQSVRGYLDSEATGDHGLLASLEISTPNVAAAVGVPGELTALAFADAGRTTTIDPLPGQAARTPLFGTGIGLRYRPEPGIDASFDVAQAHKPSGTSAPGRVRLHLRVGIRM